MDQRLMTTHVGSLPRSAGLLALYRDRVPQDELAPALTKGVDEVVRQQREAGIDIVNDGEYGKPASSAVDYGAWASYIYERLSGFEPRPLPAGTNLLAAILGDSKDRQDFQEFYRSAQAERGEQVQPTHFPICVGPIHYTGHTFIQRDIANLKSAVTAHGATRAFMTAVVGGVTIFPGPHYGSLEAQSVAVAQAMREEYRAILDAGFDLQLDDPLLVNQYEMHHSINGDLAGFRKWAEAHIELVNEGLTGLPEDRIRYHVCWGSWNGPHSSDLPLASVLDLIVKVRAAQYSVEAANPQHEHEWEDWKRVKLPDGKKVLPGVVTHKTTVLEHPELVAQRLCRYAGIVGRENVIASTDCGMGGRIHPTLAWAKLRVLAEGAERATRRLWPGG
jgi:5-methyltetrahydropteroyltriglutamate--homocysteine methyltransferase